MADDLLPPAAPAADPVQSRKRLVCEFCDCQLTAAGEVLRMGDRARKYRVQEDKQDELKAEIARLAAELETTKRALKDAETELQGLDREEHERTF